MSTDLERELKVARNEINNLRKQITTLQQVHRKDVQHIFDTLENFRSANFLPPANSKATTKPAPNSGETSGVTIQEPANTNGNGTNGTEFHPIGTIRTLFAEKRAVPRQPTVAAQLLGCVELNDTVFTNPEHALDGLHGFSHIWLIYHFHRNAASAKAKVSPPRLNGERVGVFSTRSPHRPCPIGLSLVEVQKIEGARVYFRGTDMVDGTPVLDIKPYIPIYDNPLDCGGGGWKSDEKGATTKRATSGAMSRPQLSSREEPDGEADDDSAGAAPTTVDVNGDETEEIDDCEGACGGQARGATAVRVPDWIMAAPTLEVFFNERAETELAELGVDRTSIVDVMSADPRSVYIRTKYGSQIFTFQLGEVAVTCKFDDPAASVTIVRIRRTENLPAQEEN